MKNFLSLLGLDVNKTLCLTVGSPSAHRRNSRLKHLAFMLLFLLGSLNVWGEDVTDELTATDFSATNTTYTDFSNVSKSSTAKYAGNNGKDSSGNIQMRSKNSNSGIVSTVSGGKVKSVTITVGSGSNTIDVYGSNTAYTAASDLYDNSKQGTKVGSLSATGTITFTDDYAYVGIRSNNGAIYLSSVNIVWTTGGSTEPAVLKSIAVSGNPEKKEYEDGDAFDPTGLVVTGTYNEGDPQTISNGITWTACKTENGDYVALDNDAVALAANETGIYVKATVSEITSQAYHVTVLTVTPALPKITITATSSGITTSYADNTFTQEGVTFSYTQWMKSTNLIQAKASKSPSFKNTTAIPGIIKSITVITGDGKTARAVTVQGGASAESLSTITAPATSMSMKFDFGANEYSYFSLNTPGNACYFDKIIITYESTPKHEVTFGVKSGDESKGTLEASVGGNTISSGDEVEEGATVTLTPSANTYYQVASVKVLYGEAQDVSVSGPSDGKYTFTMPTSEVIAEVAFEYIPATSVSLNKTELALTIGENETLTATVAPNDALGTVNWTSSNSSIASVDADGKVTAHAAGTATITATSVATNTVKRTCAVTVSAPTGKSVTVADSDDGNVTGNVSLLDILSGVEVVLTAHPNAGYSVDDWEVIGLPSDPVISNDMLTCTFTMPDNAVSVNVAYVHELASLKLHDAAGVTTFDSENTHYWKESVTLPNEAATCSKTFMGWSTNAECSTAPEIAKGASYTIQNKGENHLYAVYADEILGAETKVTDNIDLTFTGVSGTSYVAWASSKTGISGAVYTGVNAGGNSAIQFRSDASEAKPASGIISLTSGGKAKKVTITWNSNTADSRTLNVFGSNFAYTAVADLVDDNKKGTLLGTVVNGTSTELNITGEYQYIGLRSNSGAMYLDNIAIEWTQSGAATYDNYSTTCTAKVETPTISGVVNNETYTTSKTISLDCETEGAAIYYSLDGADAVAYSGSIEVNTYGPHTLTAYATKEDFTNSDEASVSFTLNLPFAKVSDLFTYLQAKSLTSLNDVTVTGVVTEIVTEYSSQHNNVSINIADDFDSNSPQLEGYRTKDATGVTAASVVAVGDKVTLKGNYTYFQSTTHELAADNTIEEYTAKVLSSITVDGSLTKTEYFSGETFSHAGLTATAHYENTGYSEDVTESAAWTDDLADSKVTAAATVRATASIDDIHGYKDVTVTVVSKELESITLSQDAYTIYKGEALPKPIVTAHYVDNDVPSEAAIDAALCVYDEEGNFNQTTAGSYTIKVKYTFGLVTKTAEYEVTVKEYANAIESPYTPVEATYIIVNAIGTTTSTDSIVVEGIVSDADTPSSNSQAYKISIDGSTTNQLDVYNGKYFGKGSINNTNKLEVGDKVIVKGKAVNFNGTTPEIATGSRLIYLQKSTLPTISVDDVAALEVGQDDLDITELITKQGNGVVTLVSGDEDKLTIDGFVLHAVAPGEVTVTANLAATNNANSVNYKANSTTFIVNVVAAQTRYAVTFDNNGADGGDAPAAIANQVENAVVVLPDNAYTYTGYKFTGWKVINNTTSAEVTVTDGEFTMPASAVTIQAQWEQIPVWAYTYTSNVTFVGSGTKEVAKVKVKGDLEAKEYDAIKAGSGNNTGTVSVTLPAGTTALHFHSATWNGNSTSIQLVGLTTPNPTFELTADAGMKNSTPYTLEGDMMGDQYYSISFAALEEEKTVTFSKTGNGDNRFIIYGVNAVYPKITLNPSEFDFGSVRANMTKSQVFTISANENVNGTLSASLTGTDADKFEVSTIAEGKVTVTFKPNEFVGENFSANLHVEATNASADAVLTATSIDAATPEISANKTVVDFGRVQPNATVTPQAVAVEMVNIDENGVSAVITGSVFSITPATLTENGNISITLNTAAKGIYEETLTLSAEGAENKAITVKATVASKWDVMYTSNVTLTTEGGTSASTAKVRFTSTGTQYDAIKCGTGSVQGAMQITVPAKTQKLHLHAAAWNGETVSLSITGAATTPSSLSLTADAGVSNSTPFTLANNPIGQAFDIDIPDSETATPLTLTATSGNRFVVYGVNQEGGLVEISGNTSAADVPDNATVVVKAGATLTVDEEKEFDNITVKDGATVTISAATEADNLIVENGGKVTVSNSTTVNDLFIGSTMASGKSGQIDGATNINFEAVGDVYFDLTLGADGTSAQWHAFTVPFPVDALNGVYDLDGNKLTNEVNYAIMDYHGDIRAESKYGWKKYRGILQPGTFYLMTVDGERTTYRFKKVAGADIVAGNTKQLHKYASSIGNNNNGWNGVGNPTLMYGQVAYKAQVLNPASYTYEAFNENETNFIVGTPFFIQATEDGTMTFAAASGSANYAPARQASNEIKDVKVTFGNEEFRDKLYISASEDALNEYETGKDLVKMTMTSTPKVAQIFGEAYNAKLCMVNTPMVNDQAEVALSLYAPAAGEYTIAAPEETNAYVYLTKDGVIIWNLSNDEYTADMKQGNNEGYGIRIVKAPNATTGIGNAEAGEAGVQKVVIDNNVYILRGEKMYDATGRMVK